MAALNLSCSPIFLSAIIHLRAKRESSYLQACFLLDRSRSIKLTIISCRVFCFCCFWCFFLFYIFFFLKGKKKNRENKKKTQQNVEQRKAIGKLA
jgi:predicted membrane protein